MTAKRRAQVCWGIQRLRDGFIFPRTITFCRKTATSTFTDNMREKNWRRWYRKGYRCIRVRLTKART